jgi:hypothetical protein
MSAAAEEEEQEHTIRTNDVSIQKMKLDLVN